MKRFGKRSAIFLLFFTFITGMLAGPWQPAAQAASSYHARVTVSTAKVHTSPSGRAHTVAKLHRNATVTVIGTRGSWKKISYGGKTRYIYAKYIKKSTPSYSFRSYKAYVKSYSLVMRSKASSHYRKIRSLYMNYKVTVIGAKGSYRYVLYGGRKGYVQNKWLKSKVNSYGAYVVTGSINLWKGPGKKYGRVGYLHQNNKVTVTGSSNGYLKVNYNGTKGYAWGGYFSGKPVVTAPVKTSAPAPVQTSTQAPTTSAPAASVPVQQASYKPDGIYGLDTSHHQHGQYDNIPIDFKKIQASGISYVVLKATDGYKDDNGSYYKDPDFDKDVVDAKNAQLVVNAYHYFRGTDTASSIAEANFFAQTLKDDGLNGSNFGYLFVDVEENGVTGDSTTLTNNVITFLNQLRADGFNKLGIYANVNYYSNFIDLDKIKAAQNGVPFPVWLACYTDDTYNKSGIKADIRQYTNQGTVDGVTGYVDRDISYSPYFTNGSSN